MRTSFWAHFCPCERGLLWVARGDECSWCGLRCDPVLASRERASQERGERTAARRSNGMAKGSRG